MDQTFINWLFAAFGAAVGWVLKIILDALRELRCDIKQIEKDLPKIYVRKDDFKSVVTDIKESINYIKIDMKEEFDKIDNILGAIFKIINEKNTGTK